MRQLPRTPLQRPGRLGKKSPYGHPERREGSAFFGGCQKKRRMPRATSALGITSLSFPQLSSPAEADRRKVQVQFLALRPVDATCPKDYCFSHPSCVGPEWPVKALGGNHLPRGSGELSARASSLCARPSHARSRPAATRPKPARTAHDSLRKLPHQHQLGAYPCHSRIQS